MTRVVVQLRPTGPGGSFRERLAQAMAAVAPDVGVRVTAVVVELEPVADARPDATKLRHALKTFKRGCGLQADWTAPPVRPKPNRARKGTGRPKTGG